MPDPRFDPSNAITFDLASGLVHLDGAPARLLVPAPALGHLCAAAGPEATAAFGRAMGEAMGRRVALRFGGDAGDPGAGARQATVEGMVDHLGGEIALAGLGSLGLERWGRALVAVLDQSPLGAAGDRMVEAVLGGALAAATGRDARALFLGRDEVRARFLVGGEAGAAKVRGWLDEGVPWGDALVRLHGGPPSAAREDA
jgi:hypothetical protein